jgi:hypothetical protein
MIERGPRVRNSRVSLISASVPEDPTSASARLWQRLAARLEIDHGPARAGFRHDPDFERVKEARPDQRRLAAAGGAENREKPRPGQLINHLVDAAFAAEEEIALFLPERSQAWIRQSAAAGLAHCRISEIMSLTGCSVK